MITKDQYNKLLEIVKTELEYDQYGIYTISNVYFDNDNYDLIRLSIDKPVYKEKVRMRTYNNSKFKSKIFFEIKKKYRGTVNKRRMVLDSEEIKDATTNGDVEINGGEIYVNGPTAGGNSALDFDGEFTINEGIVIAAGCADMLEIPSNSSKQKVLSVVFNSIQSANIKFELKDSNGNSLIDFSPSKNYQSIIVSVPDLKKESYKIYLNNNLYQSVTLSDVVTSVGSSRGMIENSPGRR